MIEEMYSMRSHTETGSAPASDAGLLARVREFGETQVAPVAAEIDREARFFPELLSSAAKLGLQALFFDEKRELDLTRIRIAHETSELLASYSGAVALAISVARLHTYLLARYAEHEVAQRWIEPLLRAERFGSFAITEPEAGTDVRAIRTVARRDGEGYLLTGEKIYIGLAPVASFSIVLAKVGTDARDADTVALVVDLEQEGANAGPGPELSAFRGMPNGTLHFDNCRVPESHVLRCDGFMGMMDGLNLARIEAASFACGLLRGCLRASSRYAAKRTAFGKRLTDLQAVQMKIGRMATDYRAARELILQAADSFAEGGGGDATLISMAKLFASDAAMRHAIEAIQVHGGSGVHADADVGRMARDAKVTQIFDGTSEIHLLMIGRNTVRRFEKDPC
jgi:alkylation response protein AidB-like acyl-CoA dehydrogenase